MAKSLRGFAALRAADPDRLRAISAKAGRRSQATGTAHRWTTQEAKQMAQKGAVARWKHKK